MSVTDTLVSSYSAFSSGIGYYCGAIITAKKDAILLYINVQLVGGGNDPTEAKLFDGSWNLLSTVSIVGTQATFNYNLVNGGTYAIEIGRPTNNIDIYNKYVSFPITGTNIDCSSGCESTSATPGVVWGINSIVTNSIPKINLRTFRTSPNITFDIKDSLGNTISGCDLTFDGTVYPTGTTTLYKPNGTYNYTLSKTETEYNWTKTGTVTVSGNTTVTPYVSYGGYISSTKNPCNSGDIVSLTAHADGVHPTVSYLWNATDILGHQNTTTSVNKQFFASKTFRCQITYLGGAEEIAYLTQVVS